MAATALAAAPLTVHPASLAAERAVLEAGQLARRDQPAECHGWQGVLGQVACAQQGLVRCECEHGLFVRGVEAFSHPWSLLLKLVNCQYVTSFCNMPND